MRKIIYTVFVVGTLAILINFLFFLFNFQLHEAIVVQCGCPSNRLFRQLAQREAVFPEGARNAIRDEFAAL